MELYRYESSKDCGAWTEDLRRAVGGFEDEKDYLMANDPDEDETVKLVSIEIPDDLILELEDGCEILKQAILIHDPDRVDEDPRKDGYDFDFYATWSDDYEERERESK